MKRKKLLGSSFCILLICIPLAFSGCQKAKNQSENLIIVEKEEEGNEYTLTVVTVGDVTLSRKIKCTYTQLNEQDVSFSVSGKRIYQVYVEEGDSVTKGQLLAELSTDNLSSRIASLEYNIKRNTLLLDQLLETEQDDINKICIKYPITEDMPDHEIKHNEEEREKEVQKIYDKNQYAKEDYQDAIELDNTELSLLQTQQAQSCIYASMDGIVADMEDRIVGSTSVSGKTLFRIIDDSECVFLVTGEASKDIFQKETPVMMNISFGKAAGDYVLMPYQYDTWDDTFLFSIIDQPETAVLEVGEIGSIELVSESHTQVLTLPASAIHTADGKDYVYVLNEDNLREVKWIETGLHGFDTVEITANLSEGDKVFLK